MGVDPARSVFLFRDITNYATRGVGSGDRSSRLIHSDVRLGWRGINGTMALSVRYSREHELTGAVSVASKKEAEARRVMVDY